MSVNIVDLVKNYVSPDLVSKAASFLNEGEGGVSKAVSGIIPSLLGTVASKATTSEQDASTLLDSSKGFFNSGVLNNTSSLFGNADILSKGANLFKGLLGDKSNTITDGIANFAGIKSSSSGSLISMLTPLVLGLLGKQASDNNLNASGFSSFLNTQKDHIQNALPSGLGSLGSLFGLGKNTDIPKNRVNDIRDTDTIDTSRSATYNYADEKDEKVGGGAKWLLPLLLLAVIALGLWYFLGKNKTADTSVVTDDTMAIAPADTMMTAPPVASNTITGSYDSTTGNYIYNVGAEKEIKLADGTLLKVGENSTEAKLYDFLTNGTIDTADKSQGWITLDRVYFETGKSSLTAESQNQLKNIATILKNFNTAAVKFGGYTDNTGGNDGNIKLSASRAKAAAAKLVSFGVTAAHVASEGYGPEHPICQANDTPECMAQNRRVDLRVTAK